MRLCTAQAERSLFDFQIVRPWAQKIFPGG